MELVRYNVLLVDDDADQIDMARRAAVEYCPEVNLNVIAGGDVVLDWFGSGNENIDAIPDIILMDLNLPKLDGLAVLRKLRGLSVTGEMPIVVFSAEYTQPEVLMSYKAGANSFIAKPVDVAGYAEIFRQRLAHWTQPQGNSVQSTTDDAAEQV